MSLSAQPRVGIILLSWNSPRQVRACLRTLEKLTYPNFRTLVVDNGSSESNKRVLKEGWPSSVELLEEPENLGFAGGVNRGLRHLSGRGDCDYFLLLNDDTEPEPDFLSELIRAMEQNPSLGIAGPLIRAGSDSPTGWIAGGRISLWTGNTPYSFRAPETEITPCALIQGCCLLIRKDVTQKIGLLDEEYFAYYEESDFCLRAGRAGFGLALVKRARIFHEGGVSMRAVSRLKEYLMIRNRLRFVKKNGTGLQFLSTLFCILGIQLSKRILRLALQGQWGNLGVLLPAVWHGISGGGAELVGELQKPRVSEQASTQ